MDTLLYIVAAVVICGFLYVAYRVGDARGKRS